MKKGSTPTVRIIKENRSNKDGTYPITLRITYKGKSKYYRTGDHVKKDEFDLIWDTRDPRTKPKKEKKRKEWQERKKLRERLEHFQLKAEEVIEDLSPFSFEAFEENFYGRKGKEGTDVFSLYNKVIEEYRKKDHHGTASNYECSRNSIRSFLEEKKKKKVDSFDFEDVTPDLLDEYERWMLDNGRSKATVGIYLRPLRAIFNRALDEKLTDNYPFGRRKYKTPNPRRTKKALTFEQLRMLAQCEPTKKEQEKARDWFILSFTLQGINLKDLALLKNKDIDDDQERIRFYRAKTIDTAKDHAKEISVPLPKRAKELIDKYRQPALSPETLVFSIVDQNDDEATKRRKVQRFTRSINQHLKPLAGELGLPEDISYQWARHTFATTSIKSGASMEYVSQALGHENIATTHNYFAGFDDETGRELMEQLTDF